MQVLRLLSLLALLGAGASARRAQVRPDETTVLDSIAVSETPGFRAGAFASGVAL